MPAQHLLMPPVDSSMCALAAGSKHWYTLMRRDAGDSVSGRLQLGFAWDVTARSLLSLKLAALENVLAQRQEILCALNPVPASVTQRWTREALKAPEDNLQARSPPVHLLGYSSVCSRSCLF